VIEERKNNQESHVTEDKMATMANNISDKAIPEAKVSVVDMEEGLPQYPPPARRQRLKNCASLLRRSLNRNDHSEESPWPKLVRRTLYAISVVLILFALVLMYEHQLPLSQSPWLMPL
jgi:hypothetical protein